MYSKESGKDQMLMTMERELTSGQKAGFFFLGFLGGIAGILAASLMNINAPYRPEGTNERGHPKGCPSFLNRICGIYGVYGSPACWYAGLLYL